MTATSKPGNEKEMSIQSLKEKIDQLNQLAWDIRVSDSSRAHILSQESVSLAESINYTRGLAEGLRSLGFCYVRLSKNEEGLACLKKSFSLFESLNDLKGQSVVYEYLGIIERNWGNLGASLDLLYKGLALSQQIGFSENESTNFYQIGVTYKHLGNYEKALENLYQSLSIARTISYFLMEAYAINVIGSVYFENGDYTRALEYYQQGLIIRQNSGDKWGEAGSLNNIGSTHLKLGAWQQAIDFGTESLKISKTTDDKKSQATALLLLAEVYKHTGGWQQAASYAQESLQIRQSVSDKRGEAEILLFLAELQSADFQSAEKEELFEGLFKALKIAEEIKAADLSGKIHQRLYENYKLCLNYKEALHHLELHVNIEKDLHRDAINQKVLNLEISHRAEESKKEAEIFKLRNVELAGLYEESKKQRKEIEEQKKNVEDTLSELKATQVQLIQREKMASLGELTAGIAHEIQNPLNFVNNFSDINMELIAEMVEEMDKGNVEGVKKIAEDIEDNEKKVNYHGKRADAIVKSMLQHSKTSTGQKELTDINALADEYLRLSYHGLRAKDPSFNATLQTDFDESIGSINILPQDIGRVFLNLFTNAFYTVNEKKKQQLQNNYEPAVSINTKNMDDKIEIRVKDNGIGISKKIIEKIFQPFFTTKPTGQGTGLGLSLSYDIIKAHGGELKVETMEGENATFIIQLPKKSKYFQS